MPIIALGPMTPPNSEEPKKRISNIIQGKKI